MSVKVAARRVSKCGFSTAVVGVTTIKVCPSGGEPTAATVPKTPLPPGRLSMTTGLPISCERLSARMRATTSVTLPGVKGTISRTDRSGPTALAGRAVSRAGTQATSLASLKRPTIGSGSRCVMV